MRNRVCRLVSFLALSIVSIPALASSNWQQPTPEELKMTSDSGSPDAEAVYLYREEVTDDKLHMHSVYVRLKILKDEGKRYGDVEIGNEGVFSSITDIEGRTVESDGTAIPFKGKPYDKLIAKRGHFTYRAKVFSLPDVRAGSILEYRYRLRYEDNEVISPDWIIQQSIPVHKAHYRFVPTDKEVVSSTDHGNVSSSLAYTHMLPKGAEVKENRGVYELDVSDIPPEPSEEYLPPMQSLSYRVRFYYTAFRSADEFWKSYGKYWSRDMDKFAAQAPSIQDAARELTSGATTSAQRLEKLYASVMKLENTSFTREHTGEENKAEGVKHIKSAQDVWALKRGNSDELTLVFIALARAAGFKAYAMSVTNRDQDVFIKTFLSGQQLNDLIAIVQVDGKDIFLDPGQRYCNYGNLHWKHTWAGGIRQVDGGTAIIATPGISYKETQLQRVANLKLDGTGQVQGTVTMVYTGATALYWRQRALESDEAQVKKEFEEAVGKDLPPGVEIKMNHFIGLTNYETVLVAQMDVRGSMGTATAKRVFLPVSFFEANSKPLFAHAQRESFVDLHFPYASKDSVTLELPENEKVQSAPTPADVKYPSMAVYQTAIKVDGTKLAFTRTMVLANVFFQSKEYPELKGFMDKVSTKDQEQTILESAHSGQGQ